MRALVQAVMAENEEGVRRAFGAALTSPRQVLAALDLYGRVTGEMKPANGNSGRKVEVIFIQGGFNPGTFRAAAQRLLAEQDQTRGAVEGSDTQPNVDSLQ